MGAPVLALALAAAAAASAAAPRARPPTYIVTLERAAAPSLPPLPAAQAARRVASEARFAAALAGAPNGSTALRTRLRHVLDGFTARLTPAGVAHFRALGAGVHAERRVAKAAVPSWGLDRLDAYRTGVALDGEYAPQFDGSGVHIYVVDTGLYAEHDEFAGRVGPGADAVDADADPSDCDGHGTHVAGIAAGASYGVARGATVHGVRVLGCAGDGTNTDLISGLEWVAAASHGGPKVATLSLGGPLDGAVNAAVRALVASAGVTVVIAAGNNGTDACTSSPAFVGSLEPGAITVGSVGQSDRVSSFSNAGACVNVLAPGEGILSADLAARDAALLQSGTSMAAPHVAGVAAQVAQQLAAAAGGAHPSPAAVWAEIESRALGGMADSLSNPGRNDPCDKLVQAHDTVTPRPPPSPPGPPAPPAPPPSPPAPPSPLRLLVSIKPDAQPSQLSWALDVLLGDTWYGLTPIRALEETSATQEWSEALEEGRTHRFHIWDAGGDGLCCESGAGHFSLTLMPGGDAIASRAAFRNAHEWLDFAAGAAPPNPPPPPRPCDDADRDGECDDDGGGADDDDGGARRSPADSVRDAALSLLGWLGVGGGLLLLALLAAAAALLLRRRRKPGQPREPPAPAPAAGAVRPLPRGGAGAQHAGGGARSVPVAVGTPVAVPTPAAAWREGAPPPPPQQPPPPPYYGSPYEPHYAPTPSAPPAYQ